MKIGKREQKRVIEELQRFDFADKRFNAYRDNEAIVKEAFKVFYRNDFHDVYDSISQRLRDDVVFMKDIAENVDSSVFSVHEQIRNDEKYVVERFNLSTHIYKHDIPCLTSSKEHTLKAAERSCTYFGLADDSLKDDKEFCREIINQGDAGYELIYMSKRLKDDTEFVLEVCRKASESNTEHVVINYASMRLQQECKGNDLFKTLEALVMVEDLNKSLEKKDTKSTTKKMKI